MLTVISSTELNISVLAGKFILAKLEEDCISCIGATSSNKVFVHHFSSKEKEGIQYLNINQEITAICLGWPSVENNSEIVIIGTTTHLLAYNVPINKIIINREVDCGVTSLTSGRFGSENEILLFIGGNCFLQALSCSGDEVFWHVMSDNVLALDLIDFDGDGQNELLVGTEDSHIRILKNQQIIVEIKETDSVVALAALPSFSFAYALANGTVGVYEKRTRLWRIKSKNQISSLVPYDVDCDGQLELVSGWSHSKFDIRHWRTGEVLFKENVHKVLANIAVRDVMNIEADQLVVCSIHGQLKIYAPSVLELAKDISQKTIEEEAMRELLIRKQNLQVELKNYDVLNQSSEVEPLEVETNLMHSDQNLELTVQSSKLLIHALIIFAEGVFENGESCAFHCRPAVQSLQIPLEPVRNVNADIHIKVLVGKADDVILSLVEVSKPLPAFALFKFIPSIQDHEFRYHVRFQVQERVQRVLLWASHCFLIPSYLKLGSPPLILKFLDLNSNSYVSVECSADGRFVIACDQLGIAAELIQNLAVFLNLQELDSEINMSAMQISSLQSTFEMARDLQNIRKRMTADLAEHVNTIRQLSMEVEDTIMLRNMTDMRRLFVSMFSHNESLINEANIKHSNYEKLMSQLKEVNIYIKHAAQCRVGKYQTDVIHNSRQAIKNNDFDQLIKTILHGNS